FESAAGRAQIPPQFLPTPNQRLRCGTPQRSKLKENQDNEQVLWAVSHIAPHLFKHEGLEEEN
ncbi:hypothetical protein, partial [Scytonema sp. HK-05]|uniref:hypothetical protein n=1 Tax=Scytonema sp. HK-05 TaxID=1137095 RepID=UPI000965333A